MGRDRQRRGSGRPGTCLGRREDARVGAMSSTDQRLLNEADFPCVSTCEPRSSSCWSPAGRSNATAGCFFKPGSAAVCSSRAMALPSASTSACTCSPTCSQGWMPARPFTARRGGVPFVKILEKRLPRGEDGVAGMFDVWMSPPQSMRRCREAGRRVSFHETSPCTSLRLHRPGAHCVSTAVRRW